mmetsp:Transcript_107589/g.181941  ORF Transcript_107589/g.181941 Transcript_107589/m.181941 type:complete len:106 (-) Transcript_107589:253-570(-)
MVFSPDSPKKRKKENVTPMTALLGANKEVTLHKTTSSQKTMLPIAASIQHRTSGNYQHLTRVARILTNRQQFDTDEQQQNQITKHRPLLWQQRAINSGGKQEWQG